MRAVAYLRVSSASQVDGHSLDAQDRLFRELCKSRGWEPVKVYREEGKSAHVEAITRRPLFKQLLDDASKHDFDVVVVHTLDRWSRNLKITLESLTILGKHNIGLVSITENIDYSRPEGMLFTQMLGAFAQYYSEALGNHVSKGLSQRAHEGKHNGGIPFGYESCWMKGEKGEKICRCENEHPGGVHIRSGEGTIVLKMFERYASGIVTLGQLAGWLNEQGFRTRNMHSLPDANGNLVAGPRLFTTASVRGILHNPFYTGKVKYQDRLLPGAHQVLVSEDIFDLVQTNLRKNSGRSETLNTSPERHYLLKGLIRCAYCGMPMWAQTYKNGRTYYREHKNSRGYAICPSAGSSIPCYVADEQMGKMIETIELDPAWLDEVLAIISLKDEVEKVKKERLEVQEKLRRMTKVYVDGLFPDEEYHRQKRLLEMELESLVVPQASAAEEAGKLLRELPKLWAGANLEEKRKLLLSVLDCVYMDAKKTKSIVSIKPKPPFVPIFKVAVLSKESNIQLYQQTRQFSELAMGCVSGGGGGGLNSPSMRRLPESATGLVNSLILPG